MAVFEINKGVGRGVEFQGLKAQWLYLFAGGLLSVFILVVILSFVGIDQVLSIIVGLVGAILLVWQTFALNKRYGRYGLMKRRAREKQCGYLVARRRIAHLLFIKPKS